MTIQPVTVQSLSPRYDAIYLSPHLDDAALSCGGQIYAATQAGRRVLIVTITAGDPPTDSSTDSSADSPASVSAYAQSLHDRWQLQADAVAARRAEDLAACAILGADALHWSLPDCIYRSDPATGAPYYVSDDDIFGPVAAGEKALVAALAAALADLPDAERVIAPLTVGNHVDHQSTRLAAEQAVSPAKLHYYEDYPYAQTPGAVAGLVAHPSGGWAATVVPLDEAALRAKIDAIRAYRSQLSTFFADEADLAAQVRGVARTRGGERLWRRLAMVE